MAKIQITSVNDYKLFVEQLIKNEGFSKTKKSEALVNMICTSFTDGIKFNASNNKLELETGHDSNN